jgi:hypothetical protein
MLHSVEQLLKRVQAMHDKALLLQQVRTEFVGTHKNYDKVVCKELIADIQALALTIANDKQGTAILTELDNNCD